MHDIGIIVEDHVNHDKFINCCETYEPNSLPFIEYEREVMGTDHCMIGYLLAKEWKLPVEVIEAIKRHHKLSNEISASSISGIVQIAEYMVTKLNYPAINGMQAKLSPVLFEHMRDNLMEYKTLANDLPEEMAKAREIYETQPE